MKKERVSMSSSNSQVSSVSKVDKTIKSESHKTALMKLLEENPEGLSISEIVDKTGLNEKQIRIELENLEKKGVLGKKESSFDVNVDDSPKTSDENASESGEIKSKDIPKLRRQKTKQSLESKKKISSKISKKELKRIMSEEMKLNKMFQTPFEKEEQPKDRMTNKKTESVNDLSEKPNNSPKKNRREPIPRKGKKIDVAVIAAEIRAEQIRQQRSPIEYISSIPKDTKKTSDGYVKTGIEGFDELLSEGIPRGNAILVAGGAGSGKTIFCLQTVGYHASNKKKCLVMSLEENEERLIKHMENFGWPAKKLIKEGNLKLQRVNPFDITRNVDALLAKQKGELLIDIDPVILPKDFENPDFIVIDSLTAISSAFTGKDDSYRIYIEQLFRFLEKSGATSFLITETEQVPKIFSPTGVEEFLADGVVVLYSLKHGNVRENAIEILKLRGASHQKKIVAMQITGQGVVVYPEQEVFSDIE